MREMFTREEMRIEYERLVERIMETHGYVDLDEGDVEAVTGALAGKILFFRKNGRPEAWIYAVDLKHGRVDLIRMPILDP